MPVSHRESENIFIPDSQVWDTATSGHQSWAIQAHLVCGGWIVEKSDLPPSRPELRTLFSSTLRLDRERTKNQAQMVSMDNKKTIFSDRQLAYAYMYIRWLAMVTKERMTSEKNGV